MNELTINLHTASETPLYEQIYQHIKREIQEGRITSGEKLPLQSFSVQISGSQQKHSGACL